MEDEPKIIGVDHVDNAAVVTFEGEEEPSIYPASLLHAAKELGEIMMEQHLEEEHGEK